MQIIANVSFKGEESSAPGSSVNLLRLQAIPADSPAAFPNLGIANGYFELRGLSSAVVAEVSGGQKVLITVAPYVEPSS